VRVPEPPPDSPEFARWLRRTMTREDFEALPQDDVEALRRFGVPETHPAGTQLFHQGSTPQAIFIVEKGEVELVYETKYDRLIIQLVGAGSSIGDLPVMLETPYPFTAVTRSQTTVLRFSADTIHTLIELYPEICFRWLRLLSKRLERAQRRLVELAGKSALEQIVHFLVHEAEERRTLTIDIAQGDLADTLALSRQTVSRMLGLLAREELIECSRRRIVISNVPGLRKHLPC
jgi:CRP/FNR family transcriptional regulator, cyclic AMP receptor protein